MCTQTIRKWFSHAAEYVADRLAEGATELGSGKFPVATLPSSNNITTPEERDEVVARGELIQKALKKQLGGNGGA